ncbi:MAG: response regulator [Defluviitaleaceae bacterium]|nr:response regulator [Defluviitaleaceae bacterium]
MNNNGIILLVDNDLCLNNETQNEFYKRDYTVLTATSYSEARAILKEADPDVIIMEAILPDGDGFDFFKEISGCTTASIVILTSKSDRSDVIRGIKMGCEEYIKKPFRKDVMIARIEALIQWRKRWRA